MIWKLIGPQKLITHNLYQTHPERLWRCKICQASMFWLRLNNSIERRSLRMLLRIIWGWVWVTLRGNLIFWLKMRLAARIMRLQWVLFQFGLEIEMTLPLMTAKGNLMTHTFPVRSLHSWVKHWITSSIYLI